MTSLELAKDYLAKTERVGMICLFHAFSKKDHRMSEWRTDDVLYLSPANVRFLLQGQVPPEVLEGLELDPIDINARIKEMEKLQALPDELSEEEWTIVGSHDDSLYVHLDCIAEYTEMIRTGEITEEPTSSTE